MLRRAVVADRFYPGDPAELRKAVHDYSQPAATRHRAIGALVPHAGYVYSGRIAGATYASIELPKCFVILCPNHTGAGAPLAIMSGGAFETPLGRVPIDKALAAEIKRICPIVIESPDAHRREHAIEVHLPFLQHLVGPDVSMVPISLGTRRLDSLLALGQGLARAIRKHPEPVLIIASSDLNHFEPADVTVSKDNEALEAFQTLNPRELFAVVHERGISMCGYGPATVLLAAAGSLGAHQACVIQHSHSGEVNGDDSSVVGYAGVVVD